MAYWVCTVCNNENQHYVNKCDVCRAQGEPWEIKRVKKKAAEEQKLAYEKAMQFRSAEKTRRQESIIQITVAVICDSVLVLLKAASRILVFILVLGVVWLIKEIGFSMDENSRTAYMSAILEKVQVIMIKPDFFSYAVPMLKEKGAYILLSVQNLAGMVLYAAALIAADFQIFARWGSDSRKYEPVKKSLLFMFNIAEPNNGFRNLLFLIVRNMAVLCRTVFWNIKKIWNMF